jgi:hypothetical protein
MDADAKTDAKMDPDVFRSFGSFDLLVISIFRIFLINLRFDE